jgi:hypothetical protein
MFSSPDGFAHVWRRVLSAFAGLRRDGTGLYPACAKASARPSRVLVLNCSASAAHAGNDPIAHLSAALADLIVADGSLRMPDQTVRAFGERTFARFGACGPPGRQGHALAHARTERTGRVVAPPSQELRRDSGPHQLRRLPACDGRTPAHRRVASPVSGAA